MDLFDLLLQAGLVTAALVAYLLVFRRSSPIQRKGNYAEPAWNYPFRFLLAKYAVKRWKSGRPVALPVEAPRSGQREGWDCITVRASASDGSTILLSIRKLYETPPLAELTVYIKLSDGTTYKLPQHPDTVIGPWSGEESVWSAGGLKIEVLEEQMRLRILYNGLLKRDADGVIQHVRCHFIWAAASDVIRHPEDWSNELAAQALALEPWRDGNWPSTLSKYGDGSWLQWGTVQGRFECYTADGATDKSVYLRVRGTKERSWSLVGYRGLRRSVTLTATAKDGTAMLLRGFSYKGVLTLGYSGCVRLPDITVQSITNTDLHLANFCEHPGEVPTVHTINVSTSKRDLKLVVRSSANGGGKLLSGVPYQQEVHYRSVLVDIDGEEGTGILELGYQTTAKSAPQVYIPPVSLRWAKECEVGDVGYCVPFEAKAAACPAYVGGKGASLALLASVQGEMGYKVPPGYCLTTKALEQHLEANPQLRSAIADIEAANENYEENDFREKCNRAVNLFTRSIIEGELREQIVLHLNELRKKAIEQGLGPELRFAVRSSAVGEDSEALSAAGQNETILGCSSDADVLGGVTQCWGSMFAFTSAHYRRQNGQECLCGGAVVVQALVSARAAGVMFTRHPQHGDVSRLLITANYGLGESVVSGSVEPDTIIVSRGKELTISSIEVGSKKQRVSASGNSVTTEDVADDERKLPCVTDTEVLQLARIGVLQELAWGAGRDIEWAVTKDSIYLLQARPITSLERWTEEELLHEMDTPIMSDDELLTFANTGEVLPKPVSALSYDLVCWPLTEGINKLISGSSKHDRTIAFTHNRATLCLYNAMYRFAPSQIDLTVRMMEMSVFGHKLMDGNILSVAQHRRPPSYSKKLQQTFEAFMYLVKTKGCMDDAKKVVHNLKIDLGLEDPVALLESIVGVEGQLQRCSLDHAVTSAGSTTSQFITMSVLCEGASDFTNEQCNEINVLLSSGGVLSAEVPQALAKIARILEDSGKFGEFRAQDPKTALEWLKRNVPNAYQEVNQFLEEHGHRAVMEFDLYTKPWALIPSDMMAILQTMRASEQQELVSKTDAEIVASLKSPKKQNTRKVLRWLLPLCRRTVRHRENTKAHLILAIHKLRLALLRLGHLMVKQWYLPDPDLVFHFRLHELKSYLRTRDPALLKKAIQRCQYFPSWCKLKFAETHEGWVEPLQSKGPRVTSGDVTLEATPVCGGEVVARACVVKDLSEIDQLRQGDILITHSTDIGWSPYFPLVSGIVTELGGLISHGAVIAREYGLPCLVGAADATDLFKTGDTVRLSASLGVLEKVELDTNDSSPEVNDEKTEAIDGTTEVNEGNNKKTEANEGGNEKTEANEGSNEKTDANEGNNEKTVANGGNNGKTFVKEGNDGKTFVNEGNNKKTVVN